MPPTETMVPAWQILFHQALVTMSLFCLGYILICWRQRKRLGFEFGSEVNASFWQTKEVGVVILLLLLFHCQVILVGFALKKNDLMTTETNRVIFTLSVQVILYAILIYCVGKLLKIFGLSWRNAFGLSKSSVAKCIISAIVTLIAIAVPLLLTSAFSRYVFEKLGYAFYQQPIFDELLRLKNPILKIGMILLAVVGAPIAEEILFRGIIYAWFKKQMGFVSALFINALIFAFIHFHPPSFLPLTVLAISFTLLYEWTGNLFSNIFMHAAFNSASLILFWAKTNSGSS